MPIAQIYMIEGRSEKMRAEVIEKVSNALVEATGAPKETIRVLIQELSSDNWGSAGVTAKSKGR